MLCCPTVYNILSHFATGKFTTGYISPFIWPPRLSNIQNRLTLEVNNLQSRWSFGLRMGWGLNLDLNNPFARWLGGGWVVAGPSRAKIMPTLAQPTGPSEAKKSKKKQIKS